MFSRASARFASAARPAVARAVSTSAKPAAAGCSSRWLLATASAVVGASAVFQLSGASPSSSVAYAAPAAPQPGQRLPPEGVVGTNYERTFIAIKPDGVQRGLVNKIIARFEEKGFQLVGLKLIVPTEELARGHYEDLSKKPFFPGLVRFFSSGPIVAMVWQGKGAIATGRRLLGETDPAKSLPGSIRGDYSIDIVSTNQFPLLALLDLFDRDGRLERLLRMPKPAHDLSVSFDMQGRNIIHGSDGPEGAKHEISFWFTAQELYDWVPTANQHIYEKP